MNLKLTDEQALIASSVEDFLASEYDFTKRRDSLQAAYRCSPSVWAQFGEMGWLGLRLPESVGGLGFGMFEAGLLMRALGRYLVVEPYASSALRAAPLLASLGTSQQVENWLAPLIDGSVRAALLHEEASLPDFSQPRGTTAFRTGNGWIVDGRKHLIAGADGAELLLVSAQVADGSSRVFLIKADSVGVGIESAQMADGSSAADVLLQQVEVDEESMLGADTDATPAIELACAEYLLALCWEAVGAMTALQEQTTDYVKQRTQFGQTLSQFQVVAHRLAEMAVCCEEALAACELAALRIDAGASDCLELASMAKSKVGRESRYVAQQAVQLHGAMGVTEELPVASYFRKLTQFSQQGGSTAAHSQNFGAAMLLGDGWRFSRTLGVAVEG